MHSSVKCRVFNEMRVAALVVVLKYGTRVDRQPQLGAFGRECILADVVFDTVGQNADFDIGADAQPLCERRQRRGCGARLRGDDGSGECSANGEGRGQACHLMHRSVSQHGKWGRLQCGGGGSGALAGWD